MIESKKEVRRKRRSLKESGDYLGVQGINPQTGQLDIMTPSDSEKSASEERTERLDTLRSILESSPVSFRESTTQKEKEAKKVLLKMDMDKMQRRQKEKEALTKAIAVKWRRGTKQWSSAQEPCLSPIAQSALTSRKLYPLVIFIPLTRLRCSLACSLCETR